MNGEILNLLDIERHGTRALGPGLRYAIWTQGCPFNCPGCVTPEGRPIVAAKIIDTTTLANDIIGNKNISGITISGGEPFLQAVSIAVLLEKVQLSRPELNVIIFTGFDGQYIESKNDGVGLRGSSNQRLHFLTDRLLPYKENLQSGKRQVELTLNINSTDAIGIPLKQNLL